MRRWVIACLALLTPAPSGACGIELVLAIDVSRSVMNAEFDQQTGGLAAAVRHPEIIEAIGWVRGGVAVTVMQWSGPTSQLQTVPWQLVSEPDDINRLADAIAADRRRFFAAYTAIGEALAHADALSARNPWTCARRVIDVSGDGVSNRGRAPRPIAETLAAQGVTVNALVIDGATPAHHAIDLQHGALNRHKWTIAGRRRRQARLVRPFRETRSARAHRRSVPPAGAPPDDRSTVSKGSRHSGPSQA